MCVCWCVCMFGYVNRQTMSVCVLQYHMYCELTTCIPVFTFMHNDTFLFLIHPCLLYYIYMHI